MTSSLHELEKTMSQLWLNRQTRDWLRFEHSEEPAELAQLNPEIVSKLDRKGAAVYARSLAYELQDMANCIFPYCAKAVGEDWDDIVADYYKHHPSEHFDFNQICVHFSSYLEQHCGELLKKMPYLAELADYEWLEQAKAEEGTRIERAPNIAITGLEQITEYFPVVNQTLCIRRYRYPVSEIAINFEERKRPKKKFAAKSCLMAIYRDADTHHPRFMLLGEASAAVIEAAQEKPTLYQELLKLTLSLTPELQPSEAVLQFLTLVDELHKDNLFVGSHKKEVMHVI